MRRFISLTLVIAFFGRPVLAQQNGELFPSAPGQSTKGTDRTKAPTEPRQTGTTSTPPNPAAPAATQQEADSRTERLERMRGPSKAQVQSIDASKSGVPVSDVQIKTAISRAADFLLLSKKVDNFETGEKWPKDGQVGGETALALQALIAAGRSLSDPSLAPDSREIAPIVAWLEKAEVNETYSASLSVSALTLALKQPLKSQALIRDRAYLLSSMGPDGGWAYSKPRTGISKGPSKAASGFDPVGDLSNAQYATLGLYNLHTSGVELPATVWPIVDQFWRKTQLPDGGWPYAASTPATAVAAKAAGTNRTSMTLAGLASLLLTTSVLNPDSLEDEKPILKAIEKVLTDQQEKTNGAVSPNDLYSLYGLCRSFGTLGFYRLGDGDWLQAAAANLLEKQAGDGSWNYHNSKTVGTSYAIIILSHAITPRLIGKLKTGESGWVRSARSVNNLAQGLARRQDRPLSWQQLSFTSPEPEWSRTRLLLITGSQKPQFAPEQLAVLKKYIEGGGVILSSPEKNSIVFDETITSIMENLDPKRFEFRKLEANHELLTLPGERPIATKAVALFDKDKPIWVNVSADLSSAWLRRDAKRGVVWSLPEKLLPQPNTVTSKPVDSGKALSVAEEIRVLEAAKDKAMKAGDLDGALAIREKIRELQAASPKDK